MEFDGLAPPLPSALAMETPDVPGWLGGNRKDLGSTRQGNFRLGWEKSP